MIESLDICEACDLEIVWYTLLNEYMKVDDVPLTFAENLRYRRPRYQVSVYRTIGPLVFNISSILIIKYPNDPKFSDIWVWANSADSSLFAIPFALFWQIIVRFGLFVWILGSLQQRFLASQNQGTLRYIYTRCQCSRNFILKIGPAYDDVL